MLMTALDLPLGAHAVDDAADVVDRRHLQNLDDAGLHIDLDLRHLRTERVGG